MLCYEVVHYIMQVMVEIISTSHSLLLFRGFRPILNVRQYALDEVTDQLQARRQVLKQT